MIKCPATCVCDSTSGLCFQYLKGQCATVIDCGQTRTAALDLAAEHDPYRFTGNAGDVIIVAASAVGFQNPVIAEIYNPAGEKLATSPANGTRSEERRVGKECRSRWSPYH